MTIAAFEHNIIMSLQKRGLARLCRWVGNHSRGERPISENKLFKICYVI